MQMYLSMANRVGLKILSSSGSQVQILPSALKQGYPSMVKGSRFKICSGSGSSVQIRYPA